MNEPNEQKRPKHSARTTAEKAAREARLAEAMRQNLRKRKQQQRGRQQGPGAGRVKPA
jgi:hypothetical protein